MINAFGEIQNILVVGGNSEIGLAILNELNENESLRQIDLIKRKSNSNSNELFVDSEITEIICDLSNLDQVKGICNSLFENKQYDLVLLAAGLLPDHEKSDISFSDLADLANVNYVSQMLIGHAAISHFQKFSKGTLVVLSSVAMERPRVDNYLYGSTKAGIDTWANGLADSLKNSNIKVLVVRPGMVRTKMSAGMPDAPFTCEPVDVAKAVKKNLSSGKTIIWVPGILHFVFVVLRHLPRKIFIKISESRN